MRSRQGNGSQDSGDVQASLSALGGSSAAISGDFRNFVTDMEDLIKSAASASGDELAIAEDKIRDRIALAKDQLGVASNRLASRARRTLAATNEYVYDAPWQAIGMGTVVGFLVGVLVARR